MAVNPCCMPLQRGVIIMAVIDIVFSTIDLVVAILVLVGLTVWRDDFRKDNPDMTDAAINVAVAVTCILIIIAILALLLSLRLYFGAKKRDIRNCRIWLIVKIILFFLDLLSLISSSIAKSEQTYSLVVTIIFLAYRVYMMYCVYCFILEMKMDQSRLGFQARLENGVAYMNNYPPPNSHQQQPGISYPMHNYPPNLQQQPTVFASSNGNPPHHPPPYTPYQNQNQSTGGITNPNHQYYTTNNI